MAAEATYDYTDSSGNKHVVRVVPGTGGVGGPADNFKVPVTDVEDVATGQRWKGVPFAALKQRNAGKV